MLEHLQQSAAMKNLTIGYRAKSRSWLTAFLAVTVLSASAAQAAERQKLAVLDLSANGVDKATVTTLTDLIAVALKKLGVFDVISRSDIQQMLSFEESKQLVGCTSNSSCVAEIGGALGVAKVVSGSVGKVGSSYVINLSLLDTKTARVVERESRTAPTQDKLVEQTEAAARFLVRSLLEGRQGEVIVKVAENNSEIEIDDKLVGLSPMPLMKMASGPHTLRVSKKGFVTYAKDIQVDDKNPTVVEASLVPSTDFIEDYDKKANTMRIAAYTTGAVGIAMIATGFILWYGYNDPRNNKHNAEFSTLNAENGGAGPTSAQQTAFNSEHDSITTMYVVAQVVGIAGAAVAATSAVLFIVGPKPGIYDQYKTVEVGNTKVTMDIGPTRGGGMLFGKLTF